jgi:hypothetical protein
MRSSRAASFHHDPKRWPEFARRYRAELRTQAALLRTLRQRARRQRVTLLYAARDAYLNNATVLRDVLRGRAPQSATRRGAARRGPRPQREPRTQPAARQSRTTLTGTESRRDALQVRVTCQRRTAVRVLHLR